MPVKPHYEVIVVSRTPSERSDHIDHMGPTLDVVDRIIPLKKISWSDELVGDNLGTVSTNIDNIPPSVSERFVDLTRFPCELWIYRDDALVAAGPIIGIQTQGDTAVIISRGVLYYLNYMIVQTDFIRENVEPLTLVKDLIEQWKYKTTADGEFVMMEGSRVLDPYSDFGIKTSQLGKLFQNSTLDFDKAGQPSMNYDGQPHIVDGRTGDNVLTSIDLKANELNKVRKEVENVALGSVFDYWIDLSTFTSFNGIGQFGPNSRRNLVVEGGYTANGAEINRGIDRSDQVGFELRNLHNVRLYQSVAYEDVGSWHKVLETTADEGTVALVENPHLKQTFGKVGVTARVDGVHTDDEANKFASRLRDLTANYHLEIGGQQEGASAFSLPGAAAMDFFPGDLISFIWDTGWGILDEKRQVFRKFVSVDETGTESITAEFV